MIDFYQKAGPMVIGSRLRRLSDTITEEAAGVYEFYGVPLEPKWFPVFYVLSGSDGLSVTEIARLIDHTHPFGQPDCQGNEPARADRSQ